MELKPGFTLAETLITLGIIGVVAAMTLPTLTAKYQKIQTVSKLKQTYSLIVEATKRAEADFGDIKYWEDIAPEATFLKKYIKPYYKIIKEYDGTSFPSDFHNYCMSGEICDGYGVLHNSPHVMLNNGVMLTINAVAVDNTIFIIYMIDLNGFQKPNTFGKDVFLFNTTSSKGIVPYGKDIIFGGTQDAPPKSRNELMNGPDIRACSKDGVFCSAVIMLDGWEIADDYPW